MQGFYSPPTVLEVLIAIAGFSLSSLFVAGGVWVAIRSIRRRRWHMAPACAAGLFVGAAVAAVDIFVGGPNSGLFSIFMLLVVPVYLTGIGLVAAIAAIFIR